MLQKIIHFFLENRLVTILLLMLIIIWGLVTAPFDSDFGILPSDPVAVDAIPDLGENQQIVYTVWPGRSPQDIEDQISYPLTSALLGIPGVRTVRSSSIFGLSTIYLIFEENIEFYWSRTRVLEKLNSLPPNTLPEGVSPSLGPDATALGQVFWYTLEGRDVKTGKPTGGWDPHELRTYQDYFLKYALSTANGVAEVASVGGYVKEFQVDLSPNALAQYDINIEMIMKAINRSNQDVGARTLEFNRVEYLIRGLGYIKTIEDIEQSVITSVNEVPIRIKDVATVSLGPASRRGGLDKEGAEATGAVVVARYGSNPMEVISNIKEKIKEIDPGLPSRTLEDGTVSKLTIVPFYDRSGLIQETIGTLESALTHEIIISILVVIVLVMNIRASIIISGLLPIGVLMTFIIMKYAGVDANVVALSGIAIAIGVMVDVGIVLVENVLRHSEIPGNERKSTFDVVFEGTSEVAPAIITALSTTVVSFLPVFFLQAAEGKLFRPLAFTKTFALLSAFVIGLIFIPTFCYYLLKAKPRLRSFQFFVQVILLIVGGAIVWVWQHAGGFAVILFAISSLVALFVPSYKELSKKVSIAIILIAVTVQLSFWWMPLGPENGMIYNTLFVTVILGIILGGLMSVVSYYTTILTWALNNKRTFLMGPLIIVFFGVMVWQGFGRIFSPVLHASKSVGFNIENTGIWNRLSHLFPGTGREFMPNLNEGSFLLMPTTMTHSGVEENIDIIRKVDAYVSNIPEVDQVVGKWGRVNSALDPAPISMFENTINYKSEYMLNEKGGRIRFKTDEDGRYELIDGSFYSPKEDGFRVIDQEELIPSADGRYFRQWREHIHSPDDIWAEIVKSTNIPGMTSAPRLQPIETRLIMLSTGMRANMGVKVFGSDLETIERVGLQIEDALKMVPGVEPSSVFAERIVGKPYMEIDLDREQLARYGLKIADVQEYIEVLIGGKPLTTTVSGRERTMVRLRYARGFRDSPEDIASVILTAPGGVKVPLKEVSKITYRKGPQMIRSEDTFLTGYVIFDKVASMPEVEVVEAAQRVIQNQIESGQIQIPAGVSYKFTGNYEHQLRATKRLAMVVPLCMVLIFLILYFQFKSVPITFMIFSGIFVAFSGGFIMLWLYGVPEFMNFSVAGVNMRDLFDMHTVNLSVAVWVGFIALFGVATDDGVIMGTYIQQIFKEQKPSNRKEIFAAVVEAGSKRVRPAMMTAATTIIALIPVLASTGKGSDIMVPMAIPTFGGMIFQMITMFVVPVSYAWWAEFSMKKERNHEEN